VANKTVKIYERVKVQGKWIDRPVSIPKLKPMARCTSKRTMEGGSTFLGTRGKTRNGIRRPARPSAMPSRSKPKRNGLRAKLWEIKRQLRERMHDPVRQTGQWLKSIVQGHFNYYAVPGNLDSLGVFRDGLIGHWWRTLRRRSQKRPISWKRTLALTDRWLARPRVLHPYPTVRFAASHPR